MINYFILISYLHLYLDSVQAARKWNVNHYLRVLFPRLLTWKCDHYGAPWIKKFVNLLVVWPCRLHYFSYLTKGSRSFYFFCSATFALRQILGWTIILLANLGQSRRNCFGCLACWLYTWTAGAEIWFFHPKVCLWRQFLKNKVIFWHVWISVIV